MSCVTGDETGVVKVWDISKRSAGTLKLSFGDQNRANGVTAMCWRDSTTQDVCICRKNGVVEVLNVASKMLSCKKRLGVEAVAACSSAFSVVRSKLVLVQGNGQIRITPVDLTHPADMPMPETSTEDVSTSEGDERNSSSNSRKGASRYGYEDQEGDPDVALQNDMIHTASSSFIYGRGPIEACHIHRRLALAAVGGKENDLCIFDIAGERQEPIFQAKNVRDHVLDVPMPVYVVGACIVSSSVCCVATAHHQVRFYDRRAGLRPVQEFSIDREIERRPTCLIQWNCNKFLIGEATGDVHLYDTRRGFASRAKLRGCVGSVRQMSKHPSGHQILGVTGLDRKARLFHVPTGRMLMSLYLKQRATTVLLDRNLPLADDVASFSGITNTKKPEKTAVLGDDLWDDMDPVVDDFEEKVDTSTATATTAVAAAAAQGVATTKKKTEADRSNNKSNNNNSSSSKPTSNKKAKTSTSSSVKESRKRTRDD